MSDVSIIRAFSGGRTVFEVILRHGPLAFEIDTDGTLTKDDVDLLVYADESGAVQLVTPILKGTLSAKLTAPPRLELSAKVRCFACEQRSQWVSLTTIVVCDGQGIVFFEKVDVDEWTPSSKDSRRFGDIRKLIFVLDDSMRLPRFATAAGL